MPHCFKNCMPEFKPKLLTTLKHYTRDQFIADAVAGIIIGIIALPLAIAFAIASGVSPERGLFTAIVAGFLISALGGSRVQIGGPTGAFVVIVYGIVQKHGVDGLLLATLMAGVLLIVMGFARLGHAIKFIPYPLVVGFTSGIALIIFSSQIKDLLGLSMGEVPAHFIEKWAAYFQHLATINPATVAVGAGSLLIVVFCRRYFRRIPGPLVAVLVSTAAVQLLHLPVETIGSRFGEIPNMLPKPSLPPMSFALLQQLSPVALTIALLASIEALLSAVVADGMIGSRHRSNMELIAQGIANIVSPLFGGMPATGAIARTAANINSGGRTPVAGIVHAVVLLLIMLCVGRWVGLIPMACLAAILVVVAYHMSEWHAFVMVLKSPRSDVAILLVTFALTVLIDLTVAIQVGMGLAVLLFMHRMAALTNVGVITRELTDSEEVDDPGALDKRAIPKDVEIYEINGPFFFGASYKFREAMGEVSRQPKVRIIRMRDVPVIDASGIQTIREQYQTSRKQGIAFLLAGVHSQPLIAIEQAGLLELIGEDNVFGDIDEALNHARKILSLPPSTCSILKKAAPST